MNPWRITPHIIAPAEEAHESRVPNRQEDFVEVLLPIVSPQNAIAWSQFPSLVVVVSSYRPSKLVEPRTRVTSPSRRRYESTGRRCERI